MLTEVVKPHRLAVSDDRRSLLLAPVRGPVPLTLLVLTALAVAASGAIHLYLWDIAYRHVATLGPLFVVQAFSAFPRGCSSDRRTASFRTGLRLCPNGRHTYRIRPGPDNGAFRVQAGIRLRMGLSDHGCGMRCGGAHRGERHHSRARSRLTFRGRPWDLDAERVSRNSVGPAPRDWTQQHWLERGIPVHRDWGIPRPAIGPWVSGPSPWWRPRQSGPLSNGCGPPWNGPVS